jgi:hypothetical protein
MNGLLTLAIHSDAALTPDPGRIHEVLKDRDGG